MLDFLLGILWPCSTNIDLENFFFMLSLPSLGSHIKLARYDELGSTSFLFSERSYIELVSLIFDVFNKIIALDGF